MRRCAASPISGRAGTRSASVREELADRLRALDTLLDQRGRKRSDVHVLICPYMNAADLDLVKRYRDAGADQVVLMAVAAHPDNLVKTLDELANTIVEPARRL